MSIGPDEFPKIRLEVRGLGTIILAQLMTHVDEIKDEVQREVLKAVEAFDMGEAIRSRTRIMIERAIEDSMKSFFTYGVGEQAITNMVHFILKGSVESQSEVSRDAERWRKFKQHSTYGAGDRNYTIKLTLPAVTDLASKTLEEAIDEAIAQE